MDPRRILGLAALASALLGCARHDHHTRLSGDGSRTETHDRHGLPSLPPIPGRHISTDERWRFSDPKAVAELQGTKWGEQEISEFWARKGWRLTRREERYLAEVESLVARGVLTPITRWTSCPYSTVYQTLDRVVVLDVVIERGHEFLLELDDDDDHLKIAEPRFSRTSDYAEDHESGHGAAASGR